MGDIGDAIKELRETIGTSFCADQDSEMVDEEVSNSGEPCDDSA